MIFKNYVLITKKRLLFVTKICQFRKYFEGSGHSDDQPTTASSRILDN
jgi:hypothetical protein